MRLSAGSVSTSGSASPSIHPAPWKRIRRSPRALRCAWQLFACLCVCVPLPGFAGTAADASASSCTASAADLGLPLLTLGDRNGDGRHTGRDIELGLRACSKAGGCILEALPVTYDDVAILIHRGGPCESERTACLALPFANGLWIRGRGEGSVFRSPLWKTPYQPVPLLEIRERPEIAVRLESLVLDGRKTEQGAPERGENTSNGWMHHGFQSWNRWGDHANKSRTGCLRDVVVRDFMNRGISLADAADWSIEDSTVRDIGCQDGLTPCPALGIPHAFDWPGYQSAGYGIYISWHVDGLRIRNNHVERATKYAIMLKHGSDGAETTIRAPEVANNTIGPTGSIGLFLAGIRDGRILGNTIDHTHVVGEPATFAAYHDTFGLSCMGPRGVDADRGEPDSPLRRHRRELAVPRPGQPAREEHDP